MTNKQPLYLLIGAIGVAAMLLFLAIAQYQSLDPEPIEQTTLEGFEIPILSGDPILGDPRADKTLIAFEDYACAHCQQQHNLLTELLQRHPDRIKIIWKGLPVAQFPNETRSAHIRGFCYNQQRLFSSYHDLAFVNGDNLTTGVLSQIDEQISDVRLNLLNECIASPAAAEHISQTELIARALQIQQVPAFFINNTQIQPPQTIREWETVLGL